MAASGQIQMAADTRPTLRPPKGRTWAPRGGRPVVRVRVAGGGRVSIAGVACYRPGDRPHLFYKLLVYRRRKGEPKGFTWADYRDMIIAAHRGLSAPVVWCWDNLNVHLAPELADFAAENRAWLRVYRLPAYTPDLNPVDPVPAPPARRLPGRNRPDPRTVVIVTASVKS